MENIQQELNRLEQEKNIIYQNFVTKKSELDNRFSDYCNKVKSQAANYIQKINHVYSNPEERTSEIIKVDQKSNELLNKANSQYVSSLKTLEETCLKRQNEIDNRIAALNQTAHDFGTDIDNNFNTDDIVEDYRDSINAFTNTTKTNTTSSQTSRINYSDYTNKNYNQPNINANHTAYNTNNKFSYNNLSSNLFEGLSNPNTKKILSISISIVLIVLLLFFPLIRINYYLFGEESIGIINILFHIVDFQLFSMNNFMHTELVNTIVIFLLCVCIGGICLIIALSLNIYHNVKKPKSKTFYPFIATAIYSFLILVIIWIVHSSLYNIGAQTFYNHFGGTLVSQIVTPNPSLFLLVIISFIGSIIIIYSEYLIKKNTELYLDNEEISLPMIENALSKGIIKIKNNPSDNKIEACINEYNIPIGTELTHNPNQFIETHSIKTTSLLIYQTFTDWKNYPDKLKVYKEIYSILQKELSQTS